jgi:hypothetical protein
MSPHDIILKGDNTLFKVGDTLDKKIYARILKFISQNSNYGKVSIDKKELAILDDIILKEIRDSGYNVEINNYFKLFNELENAISKEQSEINNIKASKIKELWNDSAQKQFIIEKTVYDLGVNGIKDVFVKSISEVIRDANFFNLDLESAENKLRKLLVEDKYTERYVRQTTLDTLSQYDGAINNEVRVVYDLQIMKYITNTIETSRPICVHIHDILGGSITEKQLKETLDIYCPNGNPSKSEITYKVHTGEEKTAKKGSGMIDGTIFENFTQLKGGYGCRHRAIWTSK